MKMLHALSGGFLMLTISALTGQAGDKKDDGPLVASVSKPVQRSVTDFADCTGRTSAKDSVTIQARVTGFLVEVLFKEGGEVREGDVLFKIDPRPYQAQVEAAKAKLTLAEATLKLAKATNARIKDLVKRGAIGPGELERSQMQEDQAVAGLDLEKVNLQSAMLNLDWTVVRAPIAGRIGRAYLTVGNLVKQDDTKLTTVLSMDPMQVYFDMDERTLLRLRKSAKAGEELKVLMGLADEEGYPHRGTVDFVDNRVNPKGGSIQMRTVFANPKSKDGVPLLMPGMFVRVRLPIGQPHEAFLVTDKAIVSDKGAKSVWVVDAENKVELRRVTLGHLEADGLRVVEQGLRKDDTVVVGGLQQLRSGLQVQPKLVAMPMVK